MFQLSEGAECVDDRVSRDDNLASGNSLSQQVVTRAYGWGEVNIGYCPNQLPVGFFRERIVEIVAAQPRFDVSDGNLAIVGSESGGKSRGRIALDQNDVWLEAVAGVLN